METTLLKIYLIALGLFVDIVFFISRIMLRLLYHMAFDSRTTASIVMDKCVLFKIRLEALWTIFSPSLDQMFIFLFFTFLLTLLCVW